MHLIDCEHPKKVFNRYLHEWITVSCGKCPSCLKSRANKWIERLNVERKCWKYCGFVTLTYAPEYRPELQIFNNLLVDNKHQHTAPSADSPCINLDNFSDDRRTYQLIEAYDNKVPYLSVYDCQLFIKRLRKNLQNTIKKNFTDYEKKDYQVRYYLVGEYGSTTYLPHYHGLFFFSSEKEASVFEECVHKSWKLGITDFSFVSGCNSKYVAKYLNCVSDLPQVLTHKDIRPFAIFSKCPPLGTLYFRDEKVQKMFMDSSPTTIVDYCQGTSLRQLPLWRTFKDRLFPKISGYSKFHFVDRVTLYGCASYLESLSCFEWNTATFVEHIFQCYMAVELGSKTKNLYFNDSYLRLYHDYVSYLKYNVPDDKHLFDSLARWYRVSSRVCSQAAAFDISVRDYVAKIDQFYENCDKENLRLMYQYQSSFHDEYSDVSNLVGMDILFLQSCIDAEPSLLSFEEITQLQSYGVDIEKFTSQDLSVRIPYQEYLLPKSHRDYYKLVLDSASWLKKATKTKVKNDTLRLRPEFIKLHN